MPRWTAILLLVLLPAYLGVVLWLQRLEVGGPLHVDLTLEGGLPTTLYLPIQPTVGEFPVPPPPEERPPAVILCHGYTGDRAMTSSLARRLAGAGYGVLALDARGHGMNRNPFPEAAGAGHLAGDFGSAVDAVRASPWLDGTRIVVMGHSMGAGGALDYASRDSGIAGTVLLSGGSRYEGAYRPPNALFIYASGDPDGIKESAARLSADFAGGERPPLGATVGDFPMGTAVREVEVPGRDHVTILWSEAAVVEIVSWLDAIFATERDEAPDIGDPRLLPYLLGLLLFAALVFPLGALVGVLGIHIPERRAEGMPAAFAALTTALVGALLVTSIHSPASFLALDTAEELIGTLAIAGLALLIGIRVRRPDEVRFLQHGLLANLGVATVGFLLLYVLMVPLGVVGHRIAPTAERVLIGIPAAILLAPFFVAFELLLRRGRTAVAALLGLGGKVVIVLSLVFGLATGTVNSFLSLVIPLLIPCFLLFEALAGAIYSQGRNVVVSGLLQALCLAWLLAAFFPVRL